MSYLKRFITKRKIWLKSHIIRERSLVLIYHRIGRTLKEPDPYSLTVSPENFSEHLSILKNNFNVISLSELLFRIKKKELLNKSIVITFDDGYADNLIFAKPLLEQFQIPATFFLTSGYFGKMFWWDILLKYISNPNINTKVILKGKEFRISTKSKDIGKHLDEITLYFRSLNYDEKIEFINEIYSLNHKPINGEYPRSMTKDEIAGFSKSQFIEIGGHTVRHFPLSSLQESEQCSEILSNKFDLENIIQKEVTLFAYPHGDYNSSSINILRERSFQCGMTGQLGVAHNNSDPYQLNRLSILNCNKGTFKFLLHYWL